MAYRFELSYSLRVRNPVNENLNSGNKNESKPLKRRRRKIVPRGRRRRKRLKSRRKRLPKLTDSRMTGRSRNADWSTERSSSSRRRTTGKATMRRSARLRTTDPLHLTRRTAHPWRCLLRMWPRSLYTRMTDLVGELRWGCILLSGFRTVLLLSLAASSVSSSERTAFHHEGRPFSYENSLRASFCSILVYIGVLCGRRPVTGDILGVLRTCSWCPLSKFPLRTINFTSYRSLESSQ